MNTKEPARGMQRLSMPSPNFHKLIFITHDIFFYPAYSYLVVGIRSGSSRLFKPFVSSPCLLHVGDRYIGPCGLAVTTADATNEGACLAEDLGRKRKRNLTCLYRLHRPCIAGAACLVPCVCSPHGAPATAAAGCCISLQYRLPL